MVLAFRIYNSIPSRSSLDGEELAKVVSLITRLENCELSLSNCIVSTLWVCILRHSHEVSAQLHSALSNSTSFL